MARLFDVNQVLVRSPSLVTGPPFAVSMWVKIAATMPSSGTAFAATAASQNDAYALNFLNTTPRLVTNTAGAGPVIAGSALALNTWTHIIASWASTSSRSLYVNAVLIGTDSTPVTMATPINNFIGALVAGGASFHSFLGTIAYLGLYNTQLTQAQATLLLNEYDPSVAVPTGLIAFPRLAAGASPEPDTVSATPWTLVGSSVIDADPDAGTLVSPNLNDPRQAGLPEAGSHAYSYLYLQPWKSYMDTWTGAKFLDGIGVNFRPGAGNEMATAQLLADAGFTHARIELGWSGLQYADDTLLTGGSQTTWTNQLNALKAAGIRPLILLNCNLGGMSPFTLLTLTATAASAIGATTITVSSTTGIVLGKTGLSGQKSGYQTYPFIKSIAGNVCTLSAPLLVAIASGGTINCTTQKYHPLTSAGLANSFSAETMTGWSSYANTICTFVSGVLGSNAYDVEVINEDTTPLDDSFFYNPANTTIGALTYTSTRYPTYTLNGNTPGDNRNVLVPITVDLVQTSFPGVRIINGMSNLRPQDNAFNTPPGVLAFSRHNYTNINHISTNNGVYGISDATHVGFPTSPPTNALYGYDGTPANSSTAPTPPNPSVVTAGSFFVPTFTLSCPESFLGMGMKQQWMCTDLLPFPGLLLDGPTGQPQYRGLHWRGGINPITGNTVGLWETETNTDRKSWVNSVMVAPARDSDPASVNLWLYMGARCILRLFLFHIHKGVGTVCLFSDRNPNEPYVLSMMPESFFTALAANGGVMTPAIRAQAGPQIDAMTNMTSLFKQYMGGTFTVKPLTVTSLSSYSNVIDFAGDGSAAHPDWRHVDGFGVFPFHVNPTTHIVGYYVVTPDVAHDWKYPGNTGVLDTRNYAMPDEAYQLTLTGMGSTTSVSAYDPLTDSSVPVSILSQDSNTLQVNVVATDTPRFLVISTGAAENPSAHYYNPDVNPVTFTFGFSPANVPVGNWGAAVASFKSVSIGTGIAAIQHAYADPSSAATVACTYQSIQRSGSLNIVAIGWNNATSTINSVTDSMGNSYSPTPAGIIRNVTGAMSQAIYYSANITSALAGANTVSVVFSSSVPLPDVRISEFSGIAGIPVDVEASLIGTTTNVRTNAVTTLNANDLIYGAAYSDRDLLNPGVGLTNLDITAPNGNIHEYQVVSTAGPYSVSAVGSATGNWVMQMVAFKSGAASSVPPNYNLVFSDEFPAPNVRVAGGTGFGPLNPPTTIWTAHNPANSTSFGNAFFTGPGELESNGTATPNPFSVTSGFLKIQAYFDAIPSHWRSGLLASQDNAFNGFSTAYGYYECKMAWDGNPGTFPAFWLAPDAGIDQPVTQNMVEIDVVQMYGVTPGTANQRVHVWTPSKVDTVSLSHATTGVINNLTAPHVWGCWVQPDFIHFYLDGVQVYQTATPVEAEVPLYCMVDLAIGDGTTSPTGGTNPFASTPSPSNLYVYYVRAYAPAYNILAGVAEPFNANITAKLAVSKRLSIPVDPQVNAKITAKLAVTKKLATFAKFTSDITASFAIKKALAATCVIDVNSTAVMAKPSLLAVCKFKAAITPTLSTVFFQSAAKINGTAATTAVQAFPKSQMAGNANVVCVTFNTATARVASVVDTAGNLYSRVDVLQWGTASVMEIWLSVGIVNAAAGNTVTVTWPSSAASTIFVAEFDGVAGVDTSARNYVAGSVGPATATLVTNQPGDLLIAFRLGVIYSTAPGWTLVNVLHQTGVNDRVLHYQVATTPGQYDYSSALGGTGDFGVIEVAFASTASVQLSASCVIDVNSTARLGARKVLVGKVDPFNANHSATLTRTGGAFGGTLAAINVIDVNSTARLAARKPLATFAKLFADHSATLAASKRFRATVVIDVNSTARLQISGPISTECDITFRATAALTVTPSPTRNLATLARFKANHSAALTVIVVKFLVGKVDPFNADIHATLTRSGGALGGTLAAVNVIDVNSTAALTVRRFLAARVTVTGNVTAALVTVRGLKATCRFSGSIQANLLRSMGAAVQIRANHSANLSTFLIQSASKVFAVSGTTASATLLKGQKAGTANVVCLVQNIFNSPASGVTDSAGNSYTRVDLLTGTTANFEFWVSTNINSWPSGNVVTAVWPIASSSRSITIGQYDGIIDVDAKASKFTASAGPAAVSVKTNQDNDLLVVFLVPLAPATITVPDPAFTLDDFMVHPAGLSDRALYHQGVGAAGTYPFSATLGSATNWAVTEVAFTSAVSTPVSATCTFKANSSANIRVTKLLVGKPDPFDAVISATLTRGAGVLGGALSASDTFRVTASANLRVTRPVAARVTIRAQHSAALTRGSGLFGGTLRGVIDPINFVNRATLTRLSGINDGTLVGVNEPFEGVITARLAVTRPLRVSAKLQWVNTAKLVATKALRGVTDPFNANHHATLTQSVTVLGLAVQVVIDVNSIATLAARKPLVGPDKFRAAHTAALTRGAGIFGGTLATNVVFKASNRATLTRTGGALGGALVVLCKPRLVATAELASGRKLASKCTVHSNVTALLLSIQSGMTFVCTDLLFDFLLRGVDDDFPDTLYVGLMTTTPSDAGPGTELTSVQVGGYHRFALLVSPFSWGTLAGGKTVNATKIDFGVPTSGAITVPYWGIWASPTGTDLLMWGGLLPPAFVQLGVPYSFAIGSLGVRGV